MKIIAVGDIHGRDNWKCIAAQEADFDLFVFVGDYFDNWPKNVTQDAIIQNFKDIMAFREANPGKVITLLGNHELHYMRPEGEHEQYSGYSSTHSREIIELVNKHKGDLQVAYQHEDILFTHAGLSITWLEERVKSYFREDKSIADTLNEWFKLYPELFRFYRGDPSGCGEHVLQGPLWIRPKALLTDMYPGITQVVGHTGVEQIANIGPLVMLDAAASGEYLKIEDDIIGIGTTKHGKYETLG